jgi:hypothetical protein
MLGTTQENREAEGRSGPEHTTVMAYLVPETDDYFLRAAETLRR